MKLTELTNGGGCGCKLSPALLRQLLQQSGIGDTMPSNLLVGSQTADDAAVWRLSDDIALIATTDFFSPIVDVPYDFGCIAAANALSDIYAMGGTPLFALALAAMPKDKLSVDDIAAIFAGGKDTCQRAGIVIAGGHSIDAQEPLYGLAVIGQAHPAHVLANAGGRDGDVLLLGKPLGSGILSAAYRRGLLTDDDYAIMLALMTQLNTAGSALAQLPGAHALTDVTGFSLLGHLAEICRAAGVGATLAFTDLPILAAAKTHAQNGVVTGASKRNWESVQDIVVLDAELTDWQRHLLTDPQTSGGLLFACAADTVAAAQTVFEQHGQQAQRIGQLNNSGKITVCG